MSINKVNLFNLEEFVEKGMSILKFTKQSLEQKNLEPGFEHIKPGFLINSLNQDAPINGSSIETVCDQIKKVILPGIVNWQSSKFFGYFPSSISDASLFADLFSSAFNTPAFNYSTSPSHTELENVVINWCHGALGLPEKFKNNNSGGGVISSSSSNSVFLAVHAAKKRKLKQLNVSVNHPKSLNLVGYVSQTAHVCTLRALMLKDVQYRRQVPCVFSQELKNYIVDIEVLNRMIQQDIKNGLTPFFYGASAGTTWSGAVDPIQQISRVCKKYGMWLNIDGAYLGSTWICPEYRDTMKGVQEADSIMLNFSKLGFTGVNSSLFFLSNKDQFQQAMALNKTFSMYRESNLQQQNIIQYKDWRIDLTKPSSCFKFYFLFKMYGLNKLQQAYRYRQQQAKYVQKLFLQSNIFELYSRRSFSLVCFKLKNDSSSNLTKILSTQISNIKQGLMTGAEFKGIYILRISIGNLNTTQEELLNWFNKVTEIAESFMQRRNEQNIQ